MPFFGHLSDTVGRKKIYMTGAALIGVYGFVLFAMLDSGVAVLAFLRDAHRADPARHAVRPAGLADRRGVPDVAAVRRRRHGLPARLGRRRWTGSAGRDVPARAHRFGLLDRLGRPRLRGDHDHRGVVDGDHSRSDINDDATYAKV